MEIAAFRKRGQLVQERYRIIQEKAFYEYLREHNKRPIYNEKKVFEQLDQKKKEIGGT